MNIAMLKAVMVQNGDTQTILAEAMGMAQSALNARINGKIDFRKNEMQIIRDRYHLTSEMTDLIFLIMKYLKKIQISAHKSASKERERNMNISKEIEKIFAGEQKTTAEEQDVLEDALCFMRDDVETDMGDEIIYLWKAKISGAIEFLVACGKIDEKQEVELHVLLNRIESGEAK